MMIKIFFVAGTIFLLAGSIPLHGGENAALDQGTTLFEQGDLTGARTSFHEVLRADAENHAALFYLGRISLEENDLDDAIDRLKKAVELDEEDSIYRTWLGRAYIAKLQTASYFEKGILSGRALENLKKAVDLDPANVEARVSLGGYYLNAPSIAGGSKKKAREQAEEVVKYDSVRGNAMLAGVYIKDEKYDLAVEKLEICVRAQPENIEYRYRLGMLYQQLEEYGKAFDVFERVLDDDPNDLGALYQIGRTAVFARSNTDRGMVCLEKYLTMEPKPGYPGHDGAHWRIGMLYEISGDTARARTEYETAVRLNPDEDGYRESLKSLDKD